MSLLPSSPFLSLSHSFHPSFTHTHTHTHTQHPVDVPIGIHVHVDSNGDADGDGERESENTSPTDSTSQTTPPSEHTDTIRSSLSDLIQIVTSCLDQHTGMQSTVIKDAAKNLTDCYQSMFCLYISPSL